jgi:hypothetical protein
VSTGLPVDMYRDPGIDTAMSGWIIVSSSYGGDTAKLKVGHLYHITEQRPDLIRYLALPRGWHVDLRDGERIAFEPDLSKE